MSNLSSQKLRPNSGLQRSALVAVEGLVVCPLGMVPAVRCVVRLRAASLKPGVSRKAGTGKKAHAS